MLQYLITGLAGIVLGIVGMRVWDAQSTSPGADAVATDLSGETPGAPTVADSAPRKGDGPPTRLILIGAAALAALAVAIFVIKPSDEGAMGGDTATAGVMGGAVGGQAPVGDVDSMIEKLAARLAKEPNDGEGFRMLGWSYLMTGHPDKAVEAYKRALTLLPSHANVHAGFGESLVGVAGGKVTPEAKAAFDKAIALDKTEPRARFFAALWLAQNGQEKQALDQWIALANAGPADAPWQGDLRKQISDTASKMGVDVSTRLKAPAPVALSAGNVAVSAGNNAALPPPIDPVAMQAASALPAADRQVMIDQMVEGLAAKLAANPKDADGWIRLLRSRMVMKQPDKAAKDLISARKGLAGNADLVRVEASAVEFAVPGHK